MTVVVLGVAVLLESRVLKAWNVAHHADSKAVSDRFLRGLESRIVDALEKAQEVVSVTARVLASSPDFISPVDGAMDDVRFRYVSSSRAATLVEREGMSTWLSPAGLQAAIDLPSTRLELRQLFRGLPLRAASGQELAVGRRRLADAVTADPKNSTAIAEFDARERLVMWSPYREQLSLTASELGGLFPASRLIRSSASGSALMSDPTDASRHRVFVGTLVQVETFPERSFLWVGRRLEPIATNFDGVSFELVDDRGRLVLRSERSKPQAEPSTGRNLLVPGFGQLTLNAWLPEYVGIEDAANVERLTLLAFSAFCLLALNLVLLRVVQSAERYRGQLADARRLVEKKARALAHDYRNTILALHAHLTSTGSRFEIDEQRRLQGIVTDLRQYTEFLSTRLAAEALPSARSDDPEPPSSSYLRGVLEAVAQQHAKILGSDIPVKMLGAVDQEPFVALGQADLTRVVSNLLVNAIEACRARSTNVVSVNIRPSSDIVIVTICDNGVGMTPEFIKNLEKGATTKGDDRGRGLATCRDLLRKAGSTLRVSWSEPGVGTHVELALRAAPTPRWFFNKVALRTGSVIVVIDDEKTVFAHWEKTMAERLTGMDLPVDKLPRVISLSSPDELRSDKDGALTSGTLFLVDQEFKGESIKGLELISELGIASKSVLVTNHFDQPEVVAEVERLSVRLLPKSYMLNTKFPIEIE